MTRDMKKDGPRANGNRPSDQKAALNTTAETTRPAGGRHQNGQTSLPIVAGVLYVPAPGRKLGDLMVEACPSCGWPHRHTCPVPAPALTATKRPPCGGSYVIVPRVPKATKRGRRVKAVA